MNKLAKLAKYAKLGLWIFILIAITEFVNIYASQSGSDMLLYAGVIINLVLSFLLFYFILRYNSSYRTVSKEIEYLKQREQARLSEEQRKSEQTGETQSKGLNVDEVLSHIMPAKQDTFDSIQQYTEKVLQNIAKELDIVQGLCFVLDDSDKQFHITGEYAYFSEEQPRSFPLGETLSGQVAKNRQLLNVKDMPEGYITVLSGLGKGNPRHLIIAPIIYDDESIGIIELASFKPFGKDEEQLVEKITASMVNKLNELRK